jgi:cell division transport system permease protein
MKLSSVRYLLKEGIRNVWSNRMMSFASVGVLVSCLLLTGAAVLFSLNVQRVMGTIESKNAIKVYLKQEVGTLEAVKIGGELEAIPNVEKCEFISSDEGLEQFKDNLGSLYESFEEEENFLPHAYVVTIADQAKYEDTAKSILQVQGVDSILDRRETAEALTNTSNLVSNVSFWIILVLGAVSLFIITNTIRVTMFSRRLEISIMKSVGATDWFIRVPFIVEGVAIGLVAAGVSTILLKLLYDNILAAIQQIIPFSSIPFGQLAGPVLLGFCLAGIIFGVLGGLISIGKYLKRKGGELLG